MKTMGTSMSAVDVAPLVARLHDGTAACRIELDLASDPFTFRARDWGAGIIAGSDRGHGLVLLEELADWLGCHLVVTSQPGLGVEVLIWGSASARESNSRRGRLSV